MAQGPWDEGEIKKLVTNWQKGMSQSECGVALFRSRNAVAGKVYRLGLVREPGYNPCGQTGENHVKAVLTDAQRAEIVTGQSSAAYYARKFNVTESAVKTARERGRKAIQCTRCNKRAPSGGLKTCEPCRQKGILSAPATGDYMRDFDRRHPDIAEQARKAWRQVVVA